ncbi:MAG: Dot/Icm secretion system protein IcmQ [bacterium]
MEEQKLLTPNEIANKVVETIDGLLATGDWENSVFLKASAAKLRELRTQAQQLSLLGGQAQQEQKAIVTASAKTIQPGYSQVFILLYQVDGANLQEWYRTVKTLVDYSVTRPAYKDEAYVKEFIRSKTSGVERNGYAVVNIKSDDFYNVEQPPVDALGHQLFVLKESSIKLENIVEFIHANKQHYAIRDEALFLLKEE